MVLAPPSWSFSLPVPQQVTKEDKAWQEGQHQWGTHGFTLSCSLVRLEAIINAVLVKAESVDVPVLTNTMAAVRDEVNEHMALPLVPALRMVGSV